jgi:predicted nuclease with TOPRIM domain
MYRKDAQGTIEVDLDDPVKSLANLLEKAASDEADLLERVEELAARLENAKAHLKRLTEARVKFEEAYRKVTEDNDRLEDFPYHSSV